MLTPKSSANEMRTKRVTSNPLSTTLARSALLLMLLGAGAVLIHFESDLPSAYTWSRSAEIMWYAVNDSIFPAVSLVCVLSAIFFLPPAERGRHLLPDNRIVAIFAFLVSALVVLNLCKTDPWSTLQMIVFMPVLWIISVTARHRGLFLSITGIVGGLLLLALVSYTYTIFKSQLFVFGVPQDELLVRAEVQLFGAPLYLTIARWASKHPEFVSVCDRVYFLFFQHMVVVALVLWTTNRREMQVRYAVSLASCYLLGGVAYYLLPAMGPVYFDPQMFGYLSDSARVSATTQSILLEATAAAQRGDLEQIQTYAFIACVPSLHMSHEAIMTYYLRRTPVVFVLSMLFSIFSAVSVLVLGWHYLFDIVAGVALAAFAVFVTEKLVIA